MNFEEALKIEYLKKPCLVQATALWKTLKSIENFKTSFEVCDDDILNIVMENDSMLYTYWFDKRYNKLPEIKRSYDMMVLHESFIDNFDISGFDDEKYFKLMHKLEITNPVKLNEQFSFKTVNVSKDCGLVKDIICSCYSDISVTENQVTEWTKENVFDNDLWIFVMDNAKKKISALGIADFDKDIKEGSLEWIQVMPEYRGLGIGTALVNQLLYILKCKADFVTVSGQMNNITNPERLYRRCGFTGNDVWHILRKRN